jgi:hypothetical protein
MTGPPAGSPSAEVLPPSGAETDPAQGSTSIGRIALFAGQIAACEQNPGCRGGELDRSAVDQGLTLGWLSGVP